MFLITLLRSSLISLTYFITKVLNSAFGRLLFSILFSSSFGVVSCSFIWDILPFHVGYLPVFVSKNDGELALGKVTLSSRFSVEPSDSLQVT